VGLKLNGTHHLLLYADDANLLGDNTETKKKNTETLIDAGKEVGLEINTEKTKYMLLSSHQSAGQNHDIKTANRSLDHVAQLKYLGTAVTIKIRFRGKLRRDWIWVVFANIQSRNFCLLICCLKA
jgi:hypothetical protein